MTTNIWLLISSGFISGILAGLLGIGGGTVIVPLLVALGVSPLQSVATSSLTILITSISGTIQNWRLGYLDIKRVISLGLPAIITAQLGVLLANLLPSYFVLLGFGILLITNIYLLNLRRQLISSESYGNKKTISPSIARLITGSIGGILAGLFGVGGGVVMVPLQLLLLGENIKLAIQTSLGVVVITAISALLGHALSGNVVVNVGLILGVGGLLGTQVGTRLLPKIPDDQIVLIFRGFLMVLSVYIFFQAWQSYQNYKI
ncbi:sulfite exporter TauE/SafE family protein [Merismopedia glauca]|uniref:Probable membrane transporter protein n=1 Tax=Merismopedia glauca CCAP 1448/3 TaxID=1296344 RepID=A0A2T1C6D0_9CYAN|nr:sulfite exporter TauE/SafE family protein [Merismopedia glauca]PSB03809.1 permease [Merismopedia glauca CCAP 1448/3]